MEPVVESLWDSSCHQSESSMEASATPSVSVCFSLFLFLLAFLEGAMTTSRSETNLKAKAKLYLCRKSILKIYTNKQCASVYTNNLG